MAANPSNVLAAAMTSGVQLAYMTNDMDAAMRIFEQRLGIGPWESREASLRYVEGLGSEMPDSIELKASFAYMPGRIFELIETMTEAPPVFATPMSTGGCVIVPHHVGAFVTDGAPAIIDGARSSGFEFIRFQAAVGDIVFVDTRPVVDHWLEALCFPNQHAS